MTIHQLKALLDATGIPFAYRSWGVGEAPPPPYGVYYAGAADPFHADNGNYYTAQGYTLELYALQKDPEAEERVELALLGAEVGFDKDETYISSEKLYEIIYEIEV